MLHTQFETLADNLNKQFTSECGASSMFQHAAALQFCDMTITAVLAAIEQRAPRAVPHPILLLQSGAGGTEAASAHRVCEV